MTEEEQQEEKGLMQDSFTIGTASTGGALKVYFDLEDLKRSEEKLKNFFKMKHAIESLTHRSLGGGK